MPWPDPVVLTGDHAKLEPLQREHRDALIEAVKDGELWKLWYTFVPTPDKMDAEIERRLGLQAQGSMLPFTVRNAAGKIVGMTTFMNIDATHKRVEIGSTWYASKRAAHAAQHRMQADAAAACVRESQLHRRRVSHALLQSPEPPRHRAAWRQAGRHPAQPSGRAERHACATPWCSRSSQANGPRCART